MESWAWIGRGLFAIANSAAGRGFGTTLLAAANPDMTFVGIDFNPTHVAEARAFAKDLKLPNLTFREKSFGEAGKSVEPELSEFEIVAMHGVYSWVTPAVREDILHGCSTPPRPDMRRK
jgi:Methyltransferase domain